MLSEEKIKEVLKAEEKRFAENEISKTLKEVGEREPTSEEEIELIELLLKTYIKTDRIFILKSILEEVKFPNDLPGFQLRNEAYITLLTLIKNHIKMKHNNKDMLELSQKIIDILKEKNKGI